MSRTIVALDFKNQEECLTFLDKFTHPIYVKVGMELFYEAGPSIIKEIKKRGHQIFLDLKVCDIPNTAKGAFRSLAKLNVDMINLHCYGGKEMMKQAMEGLKEGTEEGRELPLAIGVTVLTSIDQKTLNEEIKVPLTIEEEATNFATLAKEAGMKGVVCSVFEAKKIHEILGKDFKTVCPGIRLAGQDVQDQKRVATPTVAKEEGADYIVVGRAITKASDPEKAYDEISAQFEGE